MKLFVFLSYIFLCFSFSSCESMNLDGQIFYGKPVTDTIKTGFEGATQPGEFNFAKDRVSFILPGSDEKNSGTYQVIDNKIIVKDLYGETLSIALSKNGQVLSLEGDEFRRSDYPWPDPVNQ